MADFTQNSTSKLADPDATVIEPLDILGMLRALWRGKWIIILSTIIAVVLAGYYAFAIASPRYAATATLQVDTSGFAVTDGASPGAHSPVKLNTEIAIITSRHLLDQVIDQMDLQADPAFNRYLTPIPAWSVTGLRTQIRGWLGGEDETPPDAAAIRAKTVENLRDVIAVQPQHDSTILGITVTTGSAQTAAEIANTLADLYLADQVNAQFDTAETAVTWLSGKVFELQIDLSQKESAITDLITQTQISDEATLDAISRQALETETRLNEARAALSKLNPPLVSASAEGTDSQRLTSQIAALEIFRANLSTQLANQSAGLVELQKLRREADATRVLYETFLTRLQDVSLQSGLNTPHSRILNAAELGHYAAPRKMLILAMAAFLGAAFGMTLAFIRDTMQRGFRTPAQLADATGLPVMAQLPQKGLRKTPGQDAARTLRTALLNLSADAQTILCTASIGDEGQKDMAQLLAQALASLGKSVLVFNGDLRRAKNAPDLAAIIAGQLPVDKAITPDTRWGGDVMSTTSGAQHPTDLFCSQPFNGVLNRLRERYDHIIIIAPPVLPTPDTLMLAQHSDAVIYAVRSNTTPPEAITAGQQALAGVDAPITGLVMTGVNLRKHRVAGASVWPSTGFSRAPA